MQEVVVSVPRPDAESRIAAWQRNQRALRIDLVRATFVAIAVRAIQVYCVRCSHHSHGMELGFVLAHGRTDVDRPIMWQQKGNARRYQRGHSLGRVLVIRSEEHTSELQSLMRITNAVF